VGFVVSIQASQLGQRAVDLVGNLCFKKKKKKGKSIPKPEADNSMPTGMLFSRPLPRWQLLKLSAALNSVYANCCGHISDSQKSDEC